MQPRRASLLLRVGDANTFTMPESVGIDTSSVPLVQAEEGAGVAGFVAKTGISILGRPTRRSERYAAGETFISTPVVNNEGVVVGVLNLTERMGGRRYQGGDLASGEAMAELTAALLRYRDHAMRD